MERRIPVGANWIELVIRDEHWMFNDGSTQQRLVDWWPSSGTYRCPQSGKNGNTTDEDDILQLAKSECRSKAFRLKARLIGENLPGTSAAQTRSARKNRQVSQIYGERRGPKWRYQ